MANNGNRRTPLVAEKRYSKPQKQKKKPRKPAKSAPASKTRASRSGPKRRKTAPKARRLPWILAAPIALVRWVVGFVLRLGAIAAIVSGLGLAAAVFYTASTIPPMSDLVDGRAKGSVTMLDRYGETYAWRGSQFGGMVTAETVSPHLKNAVVATEDRRFYRHFGVSPRGIASAIRINLSEGRGPLEGHGGSTITQQVAKLICLGNPYDPSSGQTEREYEAECRRGSLSRKAKEAIYALALEAKYSKEEILTIYLNRAYFGGGSYGVEAASGRYYGVSASEIGPSEAATMAGLLTAPSTYSPTSNMERSWARALTVIKLMEQEGYLTEAEAEHARQNPARLSDAAEREAGGYFADWVMTEGPAFLTRDTTEDVIIRTTYDQHIQSAAEEALQFVFQEKVDPESQAQAAIVVMSADGAVRAMVGGRKTKVSGAFNRATQAMRQTGSAFKPFIYAAALDLGWAHNSIIVDEPLTIQVPGSGPWSPQNYTRKYYGPVTLTEALQNSLNIPAVKLSETVGRENVRTVASFFGIESDLAAGPALALGVSETTLLQMTGAFAGILNGGSAVVPYGLIELSLLGDDQPLMEKEGGIGKRVIQTHAAEELVYMMYQVIEAGTGARAKLPGREAAGKTGTTNSARDAWFVGFTADYVAGVWMGYDDNSPLTGVTGGGLPAEIWREVMLRVHEDIPPHPLPMIRPETDPERFADPTASGPGDPGTNFSSPPSEDSLLGIIQNILGIN